MESRLVGSLRELTDVLDAAPLHESRKLKLAAP